MATPSHPALLARGLTKRFGGSTALDQLDLDVAAGEAFGLLGPNGAGKSTTIRLLMGLLRPTRGSASILGVDTGQASARRGVAYVPADVALWPQLTGAQTLELLADLGPGTDRGYRASLVQLFELDVSRLCGTYSTGNRQKVALVAAFATRAPVLILDEPTSGLDPLMEQHFRRCIGEAASRGQTVLLSSHHLAEVEVVCDRVGILRGGRLVEVASLHDLRALRRTEIVVRYPSPPRQLPQLSAVAEVRPLGPDSIVVGVAGPLAPVLRVLADTEPASIQVRESSLEEIFLEYYGEQAS